MKNNAANWGGFLTLMGCLVISLVFFLFVMITQPGPVDVQAKPAVGLTYDDYLARKEAWTKSTQEAIQHGEEAYNLNCAYCHSSGGSNTILARFQSGDLKYAKTEVEVFTVISKGTPDQVMKRMDHLPENVRWDIVHYLRSLNKDLPTSKKSEWKKYFSEQGI